MHDTYRHYNQASLRYITINIIHNPHHPHHAHHTQPMCLYRLDTNRYRCLLFTMNSFKLNLINFKTKEYLMKWHKKTLTMTIRKMKGYNFGKEIIKQMFKLPWEDLILINRTRHMWIHVFEWVHQVSAVLYDDLTCLCELSIDTVTHTNTTLCLESLLDHLRHQHNPRHAKCLIV